METCLWGDDGQLLPYSLLADFAMLAQSLLRSTCIRSILLSSPVLLALLFGLDAPQRVQAQDFAKPGISGFPPLVPAVPESAPKPLQGPGSVRAFVRDVSTTDGAFEVILGQGRLLTLKADLGVPGGHKPLLAIGDPTIAEFLLVGPRQIRVLGLRLGVTDLVITAPDGQTSYTFEVTVTADLDALRARLQCLFPDASLKLGQVRDHIVVEGEARDSAQVTRILELIRAYLASLEAEQRRRAYMQMGAGAVGALPRPQPAGPDGATPLAANPPGPGFQGLGIGGGQGQNTVPRSQIINLIRIPTSQQILLKVRIAEMNRTALRNIGADFLAFNTKNGMAIGSSLGNSTVNSSGSLSGNVFNTAASLANVPGTTTLYGIFQRGQFELFFDALRNNQLLKVLAEPNLVALNGEHANFLAGGQYFIPTVQTGAGGLAGAVNATPVDFGVRLDFLAHVLDNEVIRLTVDPSVSAPNFTLATTLVPGGSPVPGLDMRSAHTTVELRQGQTLAIAGLKALNLSGTTNRIPGLGDLPFIGPFFSNTNDSRTEKELLILVTPYLIEPMNPDQVGPSPGDEVNQPNDLEFYFLNRIEGAPGRDFRATTEYDDALHVVRCLLRMHSQRIQGPSGYCE